jgi:hypothetical protein
MNSDEDSDEELRNQGPNAPFRERRSSDLVGVYRWFVSPSMLCLIPVTLR